MNGTFSAVYLAAALVMEDFLNHGMVQRKQYHGWDKYVALQAL